MNLGGNMGHRNFTYFCNNWNDVDNCSYHREDDMTMMKKYILFSRLL